MADIDVEYEEQAKPSRRRRRQFYLPSGYAVHRLIMMSVGCAALFGAVLGDIWLWKLIYG